MSDEKLNKLRGYGIVILCILVIWFVLKLPYNMYLSDYESIQYLAHSDDSEHAEIKSLLKEEIERTTLMKIRKVAFKLEVLDYEKLDYRLHVYFCTKDYVTYSKLYLDSFLSQEIQELIDELILGS